MRYRNGQHNEDRMRRADSWRARAEREERKTEGSAGNIGFACERFMFLWIAFNAAYGYDLVDEEVYDDYPPERKQFDDFFV